MQIIDDSLLNEVCAQALASPRLRMNYNFHTDLKDKCQRLLNAMEPGTVMPIHHHKVAEMYIVIKGKLEVQTFDDAGKVIERVVLAPAEGKYGIQIPANTWHSLTVQEKDTVIFEVKEGPFIPHTVSGVMDMENPFINNRYNKNNIINILNKYKYVRFKRKSSFNYRRLR